MKLIIEDDEGRKTVVPLVQEEMEITIGRQEDNAIRLTERNVSRKHARLTRKNGDVFIEDLGSYCGVRVNGQRIQGIARISAGDVFQIGDYDLGLQSDKKEGAAAAAQGAQKKSASGAARPSLAKAPSQRLSTSIISIDDLSDYDDIQAVDIPLEEAPRIVVLTGDLKGREFACIRSVLTVGRDFENDIAIDHRSLSRNHCKFIRTPKGEWKVVDLGSANGVQVNGERYSVGTLTTGDTVLIGRIKLRFFAPGDEAEASSDRGGSASAARGGRGRMAAVIALAVLVGAGSFLLLRGRAARAPEVQATAVPPAPPVPAPTPSVKPVDAEAMRALEQGKAQLAAGNFAEALTLLQKAADAEIEGAEALVGEAAKEVDAADALKAGQELFEDSQFEEARARLEGIPASSALSSAAQVLRAKIEAAEEEAEARAEEEEEEREKKEAARQAQLAAQARRQAAAKKARHPYGSAYAEIPADKMSELDGYLGEMCDNPHKAIGMLKRLIRENSNYGDAYMFLGSCYIATQETEKGERQYRFFLSKWPKHPDAPMVRDSLGL